MNKQIRRLAVALLACYIVLFVQLNVLAVGRQARAERRPAQQPPDRARLQPAARARSWRPTARCWREVCRRRAATSSNISASIRSAICSATSPATTRSASARRSIERTPERRVDGRHRRAEVARAQRPVQRRPTTPAVCVLTMRPDVQQVAAEALGNREGSVVVEGSAHRRDHRDGQQPALQPRRRCRAQLEAGTRRADLPQRRARQAAAGQRLPRAVHAGVELQGHHDLDRVRERRDFARPAIPVDRRSTFHRRPRTRSRTSAERRAVGRWSRSSIAAATSRSPRWPSSSARRRWSRAPRSGASARTIPFDLPARGREQLRRGLRLHRSTAAAGDRRLRSGQHDDGAAAHGDGRQHDRQRWSR